jgi:hypothetical protein
MTGPPATRLGSTTAPPSKRANSGGIPVRLHDGSLIAHVDSELADQIVGAGAAEAFRRGPRRYLRLRRGIAIPRGDCGWDVIEFLRKWHGDKRAAEYVAHKDRQSGRLGYLPDSPGPDSPVRRRVK